MNLEMVMQDSQGEPYHKQRQVFWGNLKALLLWLCRDCHYPESVRKSIEETVQKAMKCGRRDLGFALYECKGCKEGEPEPVYVCFTCKSRFCHGCGKKYTDEWTEKQVEQILNVPHRHTVFTVPKELRRVFFNDRSKLNELSQEVAKVFQYYYRRMNKSREYEVGVITVIHTFGRDLKFNPHIHALVTEVRQIRIKRGNAQNTSPMNI